MALYTPPIAGFPPNLVVLFLLAPRLEPRLKAALLERGMSLQQPEPGVWEGVLAGHPFYFFELEIVGLSREENDPLRMATRELLDESFSLKRLTKESAALYYDIGHAIKGPAHYREEDMQARRQLERSYDQGLQKVLSKFPLSERLAGTKPEEVISRYTVAERLAGLAPQERLAGLAPQERLAGLAPQERLAGLAPQDKRQLLATLQAELDPDASAPTSGQ